MKRFLISTVAAATLVAGLIPVAHAATANETFDVSVTLTAQCTAAAGNAGQTLDFGTYTAFGGAVTATPIDFVFTCTRGLAAPTFAFDGANDYGVVAGLNYQLTASNQATTNGTAASAASGGVGTGDTRTVRVSGSMPANQAGACGGATATACAASPVTASRTLTITY